MFARHVFRELVRLSHRLPESTRAQSLRQVHHKLPLSSQLEHALFGRCANNSARTAPSLMRPSSSGC